MENKGFESSPNTLDISNDFLSLSISDFLDKLRELRNQPALEIEVNLSSKEKLDFVVLSRRLKGFIEGSQSGQVRQATIKARREQASWEPNVFSSGVSFVEID